MNHYRWINWLRGMVDQIVEASVEFVEYDMFSNSSSPPPGGPVLSPLELGLIIGIPCASLVLLCLICACCCCKCLEIKKMQMRLFHMDPENRKKWMKRWGRDARMERPSHPMIADPCVGTAVPNFAVLNQYMDLEQLATRNKKDDWEISSKNLLIHENEGMLGAGAFATVYKATIIGKIPLLTAVAGASAALENKDGRTEGAVKRLPAHADEQNRKDFFHEMEFMKTLGYHVHTIAMLGCVSDMWDPLIVVEYCHYGDLLRLVRSHRSDFFGNGSSSASEKSRLTVKQLVSFAWQISDGMTYLGSKNLVHRDLAARNVLVTKNFVVKISDFGLCRYTDEALYTAKGGKLPLKWMSVEALKFGEFSSKSDVWSYGVLLWELFSLGEAPYGVIQPTEMLNYLEDGNRLIQPQFCPNEIFKLAEDTWGEKPEKRPTFDEIRARLTVMLNLNDESYGYLTVVKDESKQAECRIEIIEDIKL